MLIFNNKNVIINNTHHPFAAIIFLIFVRMIHIGKKIKEIQETSGMTVTEFAKRINTSRENVYGIFKRKSIDTEMLLKISKTLNFDFFRLYTDSKELQEIKKQLEAAEQEIIYLKKINSLLEKEKSNKKK